MGNNSVLGVHSLLTKSIPPDEVWGGVPAHFLMTVDDYARKCKLGNGNIDITESNKKEILINYFCNNM